MGLLREVVNGNAPNARISRNALALFNLGAREFSVMFHDGRVQLNREAMYGVAMPDGRTLERTVPTALLRKTFSRSSAKTKWRGTLVKT